MGPSSTKGATIARRRRPAMKVIVFQCPCGTWSVSYTHLLRERINDVAAEVARLTAALEGPGSPIESMLAAAVPELGQGRDAGTPGINGTSGEARAATIDSPKEGKGTLADRIRALQSSASRVASN